MGNIDSINSALVVLLEFCVTSKSTLVFVDLGETEVAPWPNVLPCLVYLDNTGQFVR